MRSPPSTPVQRWLPPPGIRSPTTLFPLPEAPFPNVAGAEEVLGVTCCDCALVQSRLEHFSPVGSAGARGEICGLRRVAVDGRAVSREVGELPWMQLARPPPRPPALFFVRMALWMVMELSVATKIPPPPKSSWV